MYVCVSVRTYMLVVTVACVAYRMRAHVHVVQCLLPAAPEAAQCWLQ